MYKCHGYLITQDNVKIIDVKFTDYDWQLILDFIYLLPTHSYIYETIWFLEALTQWLFGIMKTENVVNTSIRIRNESTVEFKKVANEFPKYATHYYNLHFVLDSDDYCREFIENALISSYYDYQKIKSNVGRQTLDVYCVVSREPQFTLYYPTEETIPEKYKRWLNDTNRP